MGYRYRAAWGAMALCVILGLPACDSPPDASTAPTRNAAAPAQASVALKITSYGPDEVTAGQTFNVQPGGNAAVWVRVDRSLEGSNAAIYFNGKRLASAISGTLITAGVPQGMYARPGTYRMYVAGTRGKAALRSNDVTVVVHRAIIQGD